MMVHSNENVTEKRGAAQEKGVAGHEGDASVPAPHNPTPAPTGMKSLLRRCHTIPLRESLYGCEVASEAYLLS
jgi:hypothetical protein